MKKDNDSFIGFVEEFLVTIKRESFLFFTFACWCFCLFILAGTFLSSINIIIKLLFGALILSAFLFYLACFVLILSNKVDLK